jgi:hypothetical protein
VRGSDAGAAADIAAQQHLVGGLCMDFAQVRHSAPSAGVWLQAV